MRGKKKGTSHLRGKGGRNSVFNFTWSSPKGGGKRMAARGRRVFCGDPT